MKPPLEVIKMVFLTQGGAFLGILCSIEVTNIAFHIYCIGSFVRGGVVMDPCTIFKTRSVLTCAIFNTMFLIGGIVIIM